MEGVLALLQSGLFVFVVLFAYLLLVTFEVLCFGVAMFCFGENAKRVGQRLLILGMSIYLCSLPLLLAANVFLDHTAGKPGVTPAFGVLMVLALLGLLSAAACASFGIFRMGGVLFPGSTRYVYAVGVLLPAPLIGLLVMFVANGRATGYLKAQGVEVGFFGARG